MTPNVGFTVRSCSSMTHFMFQLQFSTRQRRNTGFFLLIRYFSVSCGTCLSDSSSQRSNAGKRWSRLHLTKEKWSEQFLTRLYIQTQKGRRCIILHFMLCVRPRFICRERAITRASLVFLIHSHPNQVQWLLMLSRTNPGSHVELACERLEQMFDHLLVIWAQSQVDIIISASGLKTFLPTDIVAAAAAENDHISITDMRHSLTKKKADEAFVLQFAGFLMSSGSNSNVGISRVVTRNGPSEEWEPVDLLMVERSNRVICNGSQQHYANLMV